ncbi:peptidoglycan DD-metalloendopeptidase family protein [Leptobacterium flavescens]|uniref:Peptidoglycan DD-metalloendopeptidase family protein n=1 Tax=Leptobacterium flavescens TaxID=472055 RepID=A0A6P0USG9_9FLAO|nr:M23 family metallopeptidase [Leptobacterium flavescens]NER15492.1 peptidoglycan DD-metalloendopeptidase family protein [Leptobacterium flavescens]
MNKVIFILFLSCFLTNAQDVNFKKRIVGDSIYLDIVNNIYAPIEFKITPKDSFAASIKVKREFLLKSRDTIKAVLRIPIGIESDTSKINFNKYISFDGVIGNSREIDPDLDYIYALPYKIGKKYKIIQTFGGGFSHSSERSRYAIDFGLPVGDTIYAAREGIIVRIKDQFNERGGRDFIDKANLITVLHDDGTTAAYVHLVKNGVLVKPGDRVSRGQAIGISGFTGFTTTPHLHFVVRAANNKAIPVYFEGYEGKTLRKGKKYKRYR